VNRRAVEQATATVVTVLTFLPAVSCPTDQLFGFYVARAPRPGVETSTAGAAVPQRQRTHRFLWRGL
jgi:hypothetical protein